MPRFKRGIQYAAASPLTHCRLECWIRFRGDDDRVCGGRHRTQLRSTDRPCV